MKLNKNLLCILVAVVPSALAVPAPNYDGFANTGLAKRQLTAVSITADVVKRDEGPGTFQDVNFTVQIFGGYLITLHLVWNCVTARFTTRTVGAGITRNIPPLPAGGGQFRAGVSMRPNGLGVIRPNQPGNPSGNPMGFFFNNQPIVTEILAAPDDNNNIVLQRGRWENPSVNNGGLTATSLTTYDTTVAQILTMVVYDPREAPEAPPPDANGSGFNSNADDSALIPPGL